jgi:hypothetical protein
MPITPEVLIPPRNTAGVRIEKFERAAILMITELAGCTEPPHRPEVTQVSIQMFYKRSCLAVNSHEILRNACKTVLLKKLQVTPSRTDCGSGGPPFEPGQRYQ